MYPSSLENERFTVAIVNSRGDGITDFDHGTMAWEISRATKLWIETSIIEPSSINGKKL